MDGTEPRYKFPAGFPKSRVLFNLHRAAASGEETVIVVEGFFDCLKVHQAGSAAWSHSWGQRYPSGSDRCSSQRFSKILLMLDGDPTGRRAKSEIAARLAVPCEARVIALAANRQPDQLSGAIQEVLAREGGRPSNR
ncbi:MAG: toprim domain-containing protein [Bryobacteraceae bacterium]